MIGFPNAVSEHIAISDQLPGINFNSTEIANGSVVCLDATPSETLAVDTVRKRNIGIAVPSSANVNYTGFLGILETNDLKSLSLNEGGRIIRRGMARARVRVPASTNLSAGTFLVPETTHDATNDVVTYGSRLEPVLALSTGVTGVQVPARCHAMLMEALTAASSETTQLAWVTCLDFGPPRAFSRSYFMPGTIVAKTKIHLGALLCPGVVDRVEAQLLAGASAGAATFQVHICPFAATADARAVLGTAITIDNDGTDGAVAGTGVALDGDSDIATATLLGTTGSNGVVAALSARQFPSKSHLALTTTVGTSQTDSACTVSGRLY